MSQNKALLLSEWQVIMTLAYSAQFRFPLTSGEIEQRLMRAEFVEKVAKRQELPMLANTKSLAFGAALAELVAKKLVLTDDQYYWLAGDNHSGWVQLRQKRNKISQQLRADLKLIKRVLRFCPKIVAAGLTGSLAMNNAQSGADFDLILITQADSLWINRVWLLLLALALGKKAWPWQHQPDRWCFNLWLEHDALSLPKVKHSLFVAYEVSQVDWFYDTGHYGKSFLQANSWLGDFLSLKKSPKAMVRQQPSQKMARLGAKLNNWLFKQQRQHLQQKDLIPSANLKLKQAFLHDDLSYRQYQTSWRKMIERVGVE